MRIFLLVLLLMLSLQANAAEIKPMIKTTQSWDGTKIKYPEGTPEISIIRIIIKAGEAMEFHCHPVPSAGYVAAGDLKVELKDGTTKIFKQGDAVVEVVNKLHRGHNLSKEKDVELVVFYAGVKELPSTNEQNETNCSK